MTCGPKKIDVTHCVLQGRLGAVACLQLAVKHFNIDDHILVIGGQVYYLLMPPSKVDADKN